MDLSLTTRVNVPSNEKAYCKCGPGWTCVIRKIEPSEYDGKPFYKCSEEDCICIIEEEKEEKKKKETGKMQVVETEGAYCYCGEGYACTVTKTEGPDAGKLFFECGNGCTCQIPASTSQLLVTKH